MYRKVKRLIKSAGQEYRKHPLVYESAGLLALGLASRGRSFKYTGGRLARNLFTLGRSARRTHNPAFDYKFPPLKPYMPRQKHDILYAIKNKNWTLRKTGNRAYRHKPSNSWIRK